MGQCSRHSRFYRVAEIVKIQRPQKIGNEPDPFPSCKHDIEALRAN